MIRPITPHHMKYPDEHHDTYSRTVFGFWLYLMSDCIMFAVFFTVYAVLFSGTAGGPAAKDIINLPTAFIETLILLTSSFTIVMGMLQVLYNNKKKLVAWFVVTFLLGSLFLAMQINDMGILINKGYIWKNSAFLSAYFVLLGVHSVHICFGLFFMVFFIIQLLKRGLTQVVLTRLTCLRLFWLFLDLIWIIMFSYVFLLGDH